MKTKTPATLRALAITAIRSESASKADTVRALYALAYAEPLTPENVAALYVEAGSPLKGNGPGTYASQLARATKLADAGHALPDLRDCATADAVHIAVKAAYDAAGLGGNAGRKACPVKAAKEAAKEAKEAAKLAAKLAESAEFVAAVGKPTAAQKAAATKARADADAKAAEFAAAAERVQVAEAAKAAETPKVDAPKATKPKDASPAERKATRTLMQDAAHLLAALAKRCAADPIARGAFAASVADLEAKARAMIGAVDDAEEADAGPAH